MTSQYRLNTYARGMQFFCWSMQSPATNCRCCSIKFHTHPRSQTQSTQHRGSSSQTSYCQFCKTWISNICQLQWSWGHPHPLLVELSPADDHDMLNCLAWSYLSAVHHLLISIYVDPLANTPWFDLALKGSKKLQPCSVAGYPVTYHTTDTETDLAMLDPYNSCP